MTRKKNTGLQVCRRPGGERTGPVLMIALCAGVLFALARLTGLEDPWLPALTGAAVWIPELLPGKRGWSRSVTLALPVLLLLIFRDSILDGFCQWYNGLGRIYTAGTGTVLPLLEASESAPSRVLFAGWTAMVLSMGLVFLSRWGRSAVSAGALLLCVGASFLLGKRIDPLPLILAAALLCGGRKHGILPLTILTLLMLLSQLPGIEAWAQAGSGAIRQQLHSRRYETNATTLPEGRLEPLGSSDAVALVVTLEKPEVLYLRGYTGAELADGRWLPLDTRLLAEHQELLYWLNSREFDLRAQFETAASVLETRRNTVTVQNVGACSAYRYIPFTVCEDDRLISENLTDTAAGERYDSFTTVYGGAAVLPELVTALETAESSYLRAEAAYREFVRANYLTVPEGLAAQLQPYWEKAEGLDARSAVKAVLEDCYPDGVPNDPFSATAAVLTLRHFGIPARYAEGYILPQTNQTTLELTGRHAACWAEVYHDGIGWVPMALTPGSDGETEPDQSQTPDTPEQTLPPETQPQTEPEPDGGEQVRIHRMAKHGAVIGLLLLVLAAAAVYLRRRLLLEKRRAILDQADVREAIVWSFADAVGLLGRMGIRHGSGSLDALLEPLREAFGPELAAQFEGASRIHARALFSSHPMTEAERAEVHALRASVLACLKTHSKRLHRFWMQYILCLF